MKIKIFGFSMISILLLVGFVCGKTVSNEELARQIMSSDDAASKQAIKSLRAMGKEGLETLFKTYSAEIDKFTADGEVTENWKRIAFALDSVAMQKDSYASHLFWFTDLAEAKRAAVESNRPILSLRLLGNLNEEFSCANSRFFRAILYSNSEISKYLRENYILHWKSVRPAPKVTIDFGDGRKIERTLTGNSIHYVLDENGKIIDALPGLYNPQSFLKYVKKENEIKNLTFGLSGAVKDKALFRYHESASKQIELNRDKAVLNSRVQLVEPKDGTAAIVVLPRAVTKMATEVKIVDNINSDFSRFEPQLNLDDWRKLADLYSGNTKLDPSSTAFIRRQNSRNGLNEAEFKALLANLESYIALDTVRNDFLFHPKLFQMINQNKSDDLETLNAKIYGEIFKTPDSDKWLGLYSADVYTALDGNGIIR